MQVQGQLYFTFRVVSFMRIQLKTDVIHKWKIKNSEHEIRSSKLSPSTLVMLRQQIL
jgi:hypothetical protein